MSPEPTESSRSGRSTERLRLASLCVHGGHRPTEHSPGLVSGTHRSSTFLQNDAARAAAEAGRWDEALVYSRYGNPSVSAVERKLCALEGAERSLVFASGMAALHAAILAHTPRGKMVALSSELYGGTRELVGEGLAAMGLGSTIFDIRKLATLERALRSDVALVVCESVSNPTLSIADVPRIAELTHAAGAKLLVDATFVTPFGQRPLKLGADLVMHSASKYMGGHSDLIAGVVCGSQSELDPIWAWRKRAGGCLDPEAAFLLDRGLKTLAVRMRAHTDGAQRLAQFLHEHPAVERVFYPGLEGHSTYDLAGRLLDLSGGMLAFEVKDGARGAREFVSRLMLAYDAPSLGGVETLVSLPNEMSHAHLSPEARLAAGIPPGLVRVSVGIEDPTDLVEDFRRALEPDSALAPANAKRAR